MVPRWMAAICHRIADHGPKAVSHISLQTSSHDFSNHESTYRGLRQVNDGIPRHVGWILHVPLLIDAIIFHSIID